MTEHSLSIAGWVLVVIGVAVVLAVVAGAAAVVWWLVTRAEK